MIHALLPTTLLYDLSNVGARTSNTLYRFSGAPQPLRARLRLEVILKLTRELGVNLAGVEIILNMREKMEAMQSQIQEFMAGLNPEISSRTRAAAGGVENSLIPVVSRTPAVVAGPRKRKR